MLKTKAGKRAALLSVVVATAIGWFLISPLFIDEHVDEALGFTSTAAATMPTRDQVAAMPPEERNRAMQQAMAKLAQKPNQEVQQGMMEATEPQLQKRGIFRDADAIHRGSGNALLYRLADDSHLLRLEDFKVTNGPDLAVYLLKHPNPEKSADITSGFLNLGKLKGNVGNQNYSIPAGTNVSEFKSAVIWCELFGVLFSAATLAEN